MFSIDPAQFAPLLDKFNQQGWVLAPHFVPAALNQALLADLQQQQLQQAGVGRQQAHSINADIRRDKTAWFDGQSAAQQQYLQLMQALQQAFNRAFFLGLFDFECHYARYSQGDFYHKHLDAFSGRSNRVLTTVSYLNTVSQGGELQLFSEEDQLISSIVPTAGSLILFESERFPHQVLPAEDERYSIAGWFRRNNSLQGHIDPPN
ncbi:2OG-Fe(II) oxygenase [Rheinheimera sp. UJ51]|uniref:2OG-Fe(II) oxygenase n=1 Tax=Rheinheimera sp. UJ51 TaxID=2892446 RepID=UPI001E59D266|nr:2OG-Fe(II) oxygenase [Rheinheimera sp. UJ51]MCC5450899.1 2OG-Fe(II) oxygenase [Rheinheimera sp. UJ51]